MWIFGVLLGGIAVFLLSDAFDLPAIVLVLVFLGIWIGPALWLGDLDVSPAPRAVKAADKVSQEKREFRAQLAERLKELDAAKNAADARGDEVFVREEAIEMALIAGDITPEVSNRLEQTVRSSDAVWATAWHDAIGEHWEFQCRSAGGHQIDVEGFGHATRWPMFTDAAEYHEHVLAHLRCRACGQQYETLNQLLGHWSGSDHY